MVVIILLKYNVIDRLVEQLGVEEVWEEEALETIPGVLSEYPEAWIFSVSTPI